MVLELTGLDRKAHRIATTAVERRPEADFEFELQIAYDILAALGIKE